MTHGSHARPDPGEDRRRRRSWWRVGTPLAVLLSGSLFVISAQNSDGTDLRPGRYTDLASVVSTDADRYAALQDRVADLTDQVATLTDSVGDANVRKYQRTIAVRKDPAGLVRREGPGVTVTLSDAPEDVIDSTERDLNLLVVHQQDIQAVVNAMWSAGARAVTIQGQRIVSTTGIKCEGNSVLLQGVPYGQPYRISAIGDPGALTTSIENDDTVVAYREQSQTPDIAVGWDLTPEPNLVAPAYQGLLDLSYAQPLG